MVCIVEVFILFTCHPYAKKLDFVKLESQYHWMDTKITIYWSNPLFPSSHLRLYCLWLSGRIFLWWLKLLNMIFFLRKKDWSPQPPHADGALPRVPGLPRVAVGPVCFRGPHVFQPPPVCRPRPCPGASTNSTYRPDVAAAFFFTSSAPSASLVVCLPRRDSTPFHSFILFPFFVLNMGQQYFFFFFLTTFSCREVQKP